MAIGDVAYSVSSEGCLMLRVVPPALRIMAIASGCATGPWQSATQCSLEQYTPEKNHSKVSKGVHFELYISHCIK